MSTEGDSKTDRRGEPRVPFDGAVRLRFQLFQEFLEENAANISSGGMFIRTTEPSELGTELDFEIRLDDDFTLIQGRGEVTWVRRGSDEPGMGIRFIELAGDSRNLVDTIVRERLAAGLAPFDLEGRKLAAPTDSGDTPAPVDDSSAPRPAAAAVGWSRFGRLGMIALIVMSAVIGAAAVLVFYWLFVQP